MIWKNILVLNFCLQGRLGQLFPNTMQDSGICLIILQDYRRNCFTISTLLGTLSGGRKQATVIDGEVICLAFYTSERHAADHINNCKFP